MPIKLLAIDTATEACSAALSYDGQVISRYELAPRRHAELILPMLDELLAEAGLKPQALDAIAFGCGPGAFTGVRLAASVCQGIAYAADLPVVPVSTLAAMAQGAKRLHGATRILPAIDARMQEIYFAHYVLNVSGVVGLLNTEQVLKPTDIEIPKSEQWFGVGTAWSSYGEVLAQLLGDKLVGYVGEFYPQAQDIVTLALPALKAGKHVSAAEALPVYLRDDVAKKSAQQGRA